MSFVDCVVDSDYEILDEYPYTIRRKSNARVVSESIATGGYIQYSINGKQYRKHCIIVLQFIPNDDPEHKTQVDHINHICYRVRDIENKDRRLSHKVLFP